MARDNIQVRVGTGGTLRESIRRDARMAEAELARRPVNMQLGTKGFKQPLGRITHDVNEFNKSMDASVARVLAFGATMAVINAFGSALKGMAESAIRVEKSLADVNVILNLTSKNLSKFSDDLYDVARNTASTFDTVAEAAQEFARQGLGAAETLKRINDALILSRLSGLGAVQSVSALTAAVNSFSKTGITTTEVINRLANVDAAFAVSSADLANALQRAGAAAQGAKVEFNELLAVTTSVQQQTARGGAVIGNAFKSIFTRLQRSRVRETLEGIGVATETVNGNLRSAMDVLKDYAGVYDGLSDQQRAYTDQQIAGLFQINNLKALLQDLTSEYSIYDKALKTAQLTTNEGIARNEELNKTLSALLSQTGASIDELAAKMGKLGLTEGLSKFMEMVKGVVDFLNKALGDEEGSTIAKNLVRGIGGFLTGPGLVIIGAAIAKIFVMVAKFGTGALKEILGLNVETKRQESLQKAITMVLRENEVIMDQITAAAGNTAQQEQILLNFIKQETTERLKQEAIVKRMAASGTLVGVGAGPTGFAPAGRRGARKIGKQTLGMAGGFVPTHAEKIMEIQGMKKAKYPGSALKRPKVQKTRIHDGQGKSFMATTNGHEKIQTIRNPATGRKGSFVEPHPRSFAKVLYDKKLKSMGMSSASGYVPNFAKKVKASGKTRSGQLNATGLVTMITPSKRVGEQRGWGLDPATGDKVVVRFAQTGPKTHPTGGAERSLNALTKRRIDMATRSAIPILDPQFGGGPVKKVSSMEAASTKGRIFESAARAIMGARSFGIDTATFDFIGGQRGGKGGVFNWKTMLADARTGMASKDKNKMAEKTLRFLHGGKKGFAQEYIDKEKSQTKRAEAKKIYNKAQTAASKMAFEDRAIMEGHRADSALGSGSRASSAVPRSLSSTVATMGRFRAAGYIPNFFGESGILGSSASNMDIHHLGEGGIKSIEATTGALMNDVSSKDGKNVWRALEALGKDSSGLRDVSVSRDFNLKGYDDEAFRKWSKTDGTAKRMTKQLGLDQNFSAKGVSYKGDMFELYSAKKTAGPDWKKSLTQHELPFDIQHKGRVGESKALNVMGDSKQRANILNKTLFSESNKGLYNSVSGQLSAGPTDSKMIKINGDLAKGMLNSPYGSRVQSSGGQFMAQKGDIKSFARDSLGRWKTARQKRIVSRAHLGFEGFKGKIKTKGMISTGRGAAMVGKGMRAIGRAGGAEGFIPGFAPFTGGKVYDFDETLVKYPKGTLESELFKPDSIRKASLTDLGERVKRTGDPINILTARANDSHAAIKDFLTKNGIQFNKIIPSANMYTNVGRHGEMDSAGKKGKFLESIWKKNKLPIELIDDSIANIKRIEALGNKDITGRLYQEEGQQGLGQNLSPLKKKSRRLEKIARIMKAKGKTGIYETIKRIKFGGRKPMAMAGGWVPNFGALNRGPMKIPKILEQIAKEIQGAKKGANSQIIGGATRDHLLGIKPKDYDMEIFGLTQEKLLPILSKYGKLSKHEVGPNNFGVFKLRRGKEEYDFTLPRREVKLEGSGRRDFGVEVDPMMSKAEAATRRDLTVNAIGYDPLKKKFLDNEMSTLGIRDLESKIMRPTSPKFMEDPLRVLRAMQFAGRYGMTADQSLIKHSKSMVNQFSSLPKERVRDEWMKWATKSTDPGKGLEFLKQSGWIKHFPEIEKLSAIKQSPKWHPEGDVFEHVKLVTDSLAKNKGWQKLNEKSRGKVMLSALTHDFGKATHTQMTSKGITSRGHAEAGVEPMKKFLGRIMSKGEASKLSKQIEPYVKEHMFHTGFPSNITEKSIRRLSSRLAKGGGTMEEFIPLMEADLGGRGLQPTGSRANIKHMNEVKKMVAKLKLAQGGPKRLIEGRHLLANNLMKPGPQMGGVLKLLEEAQLQGRFRTESGGLSYFKKHQRDLLGKTAAEGFIPNFSVSAKWLKKRGVSKLGEGLMRATDAKTGTWTDFAKDGARVRIANASRGPKDLRGGAYRNFKTINEYAKKSGAKGVYSGDIIQQRIGKGVSPWEQIVNSFPQLKYRIQKGMKTSGSFQLGEGNEFNFKSLTDFKKQIKSHVKKYGKEDLEWLDTNMRMNFGEEVQGFDWMTSRTKGMGDAAARFKAGGFVPNFAAAMRGGRGSLDRRAIDRGASLKRAELGGASALDEYVKRELIGKNFTTLSRTVGDSWQSRAISGQALSMAGETGFKNSLFGAIAKTYKGGMVPAGENPIITAKNWANVPGDKKRSLSKQWRNLNLAPKKPADPVYNSDEQFYRDILSRRTYAGGHVPNFMRVSRLSKRAPNTVKKGSGRFLKDEWAEKSLIESRGVAGNRWSVMDAKRDLGLHQDKGRWSKLDHRKWRRYIIKSHGEAAYVKVGEGARKIQNLPLDKADDALQVFGFSGGHVPNFAGGAPSWFRPADQRRRGLSQGRSYRRLASDDHNAEVFAALKRKTRGSLDKVKQKLVEKMVGVYIKGGLPARVGADAITSLVSGTAAGLPLQAYALDMASMHGKGLMEMGKNLWGGRNPFKGLGSHYESQLTARSPLGPVGGNATYGGGYTPNFASKFSTQAYTRGTGMRHTDALIKQPSNPDFIGNMKSYMEYNKSGAGMRHIDMMRSYNKGDAFELMRAASRQKFMKDGGAYTSKTLKQQRSFMQGGRTNFEDLVYSFPQLKYRMQEGLKSSGLFSMGSPISRNHSKFNNLGELKKNVNKMSRKDFKEALGNGNNIQLRDLETKLVKQSSDGGIYNNIAAQGFIPNFANELLASMKRESYASGRAAIPVFSKKLKRTVVWNKGQESKYGKGQVDKAIQRDHLDRGQDPRTLHATGSGKERYAASGFVPGFAGFGLDLGALQQLEKAKIKAEQRGMINAGDTVSAERKAAEKAMLEAKIKADAAVAEKAAAEKAAGARVAAEQARLRVEAGKDPKPARGTQADRRGEVRKGHHSQGAGVRLPLEPKAVAPMRPTPPPVVDFAPPRPSKYGVSQSGPLSTAPVDPSMVRAQHGVLEGTARTVKGSPVGMEMKGIQAEIARHESVMNRGSNVPAAVKSTGQPLATLGEVGSKSGQALGVAGGKAQSTAQARAMAVAEFGGAAQSVTDHGKFKEATAAKETTKAVTDLKKTVEKGDAATVKATEKTAADLKKSIQVDRKTARLTGQGQTPRNLLPHERALELRGKLMEERGVGRGSATRQAQIQANNELRSSGDERRVKKGWMKRQAARTFELNRVIGSEAPLQIHEKAKLERSQAVSGASKIDPKSEAGKNTAAARPVEEGTTNRAAARRAAEVKQAAQKESSRNNRERQQRQSEERRARTGTREAQRAAAARGALDQRAAAKSQKPVTSAIEGGQRAMGLAFMGQIAASVALPYAEDYAKKQKEGGGVFSEAGGAGALKGGLQFGQFGIMAMFLKGGAWGVAIAAAIAALGALIHAFDMGTENSKELAERGQKERGEKGKKIQREVEQRSSAMQAYAAYTRTKKTATNVEDVKSAKRKFRTAVSGVEDRDDRQKLLDFERKGSSFRTAREWSEKRDQKSIGEAGELKATNVFDVAAFEEGFSEEGKEMDEVNRIYNDSATGFANAMDKLSKEDLEGFKKKLEETGNVKWGILSDMEEMRDGEQGSAEFKEAQSRFMGRKLSTEEIQTLKVDIEKAAGKSEVLDRAATDAGEGSQEAFKKAVVAFNEGVIRAIDNKEDEEDDTEAVKAVKLNEVFEQLGEEIEHQKKMFSEYNSIIKKAADAHVNLIATIDQSAIDLSVGWASAMSGLEANVDSFNADFAERSGEIGGFEKIERQFAARRAEAGRDKSIGQTQADSTMRVKIQQQEGLATNQWEDKAREYNQRADMKINEYIMKQQQGGDDDMKGDDKRIITELQDKVLADFDKGNKGVGGKAGRMKSADSLAQAVVEATTKNLFQPLDEDAGVKEYRKAQVDAKKAIEVSQKGTGRGGDIPDVGGQSQGSDALEKEFREKKELFEALRAARSSFFERTSTISKGTDSEIGDYTTRWTETNTMDQEEIYKRLKKGLAAGDKQLSGFAVGREEGGDTTYSHTKNYAAGRSTTMTPRQATLFVEEYEKDPSKRLMGKHGQEHISVRTNKNVSGPPIRDDDVHRVGTKGGGLHRTDPMSVADQKAIMNVKGWGERMQSLKYDLAHGGQDLQQRKETAVERTKALEGKSEALERFKGPGEVNALRVAMEDKRKKGKMIQTGEIGGDLIDILRRNNSLETAALYKIDENFQSEQRQLHAENDRQTRELQQNRKVAEAQLKVEEEQAMKLEALDNLNTLSSKMVTGGELRKLYASAGVVSAARNSGSMSDKALRANSKKSIADITGISQLFNKQDRMDLAGNNVRLYTDALRAGGDDQSADEIERIWNKTKEQMESGEIATPFASAEEKLEEAINSLTTEMRAQSEADEAKLFTFEIPEKLAASWDSLEQGIANLASAPLMDGSALNSLEQADRDLTTQIQNLTTTLDKLDSIKPGGGGGQWNEEQLTGTDTNDDNFVQQISARKLIDKKRILLEQGLAGENEEQWGKDVEEWDTIDKHLKDITGAKWNAKDQAWEQKSDAQMRSEGIDPTALPFGQDRSRQYESFRTSGVKTVRHPKTGKYDTGYEEEIGRYYEHQKRNKTGGIGRTGKGSRDTDATFFTGESNPYGGGRLQTSPEGDGTLPSYGTLGATRYTPERLRELAEATRKKDAAKHAKNARLNAQRRLKTQQQLIRRQRVSPMQLPPLNTTPVASPSRILFGNNAPIARQMHSTGQPIGIQGSNISPPPPASRRPGSWLPPLPKTEPPGLPLATVAQSIPRRELFNPEGDLREDATVEELNRSMSELQELVNRLGSKTSASGGPSLTQSTYPGLITATTERLAAVNARLSTANDPFQSTAAPITTGDQGVVGDAGAGGAAGAGEPLVSALTTLRTAVQNSNASESTAVLTQALTENKEALAGFSEAVQNISQSVEHSVDGALDIDLGIGNLGGIIEAAMGPVKAAIVEQVKASVLQQINGLRVDLGLTGN